MDSWQEELEDFYQVLRGEGWSRKEALAECELKEGRRGNVDAVYNNIKLRYCVPKDVFNPYGGYDNLTLQKREHYLWLVGVDTKNYRYTEDLGYFSRAGKREFGWFIFGSERTDEHWTSMWIEGVRIASWESQLAGSNDYSLKEHLRGMSLQKGDSLAKIGM